MHNKVLLIALLGLFICCNAFAMCGMCGSDAGTKETSGSVFSAVSREASVKNGVKEISYEQFMKIRDSGEKYVLLDVLGSDSYNKGHIDNAVSFPVDTINKNTAAQKLSKDDHVIVYCGSFKCTASTEAAKKLSALGYNVLDYKGGLKEWQEKGHSLIN